MKGGGGGGGAKTGDGGTLKGGRQHQCLSDHRPRLGSKTTSI